MAKHGAPTARFRIGGIPIEVQPVFFVILFLFGWVGALDNIALWVAVGFAAILVHEFGHALVARAFGSPARIQLNAGGGLTFHDPFPPGPSLLVTLAGPATGLAIGLPLLLLLDPADYSGLAKLAIEYTVFVSLVWAVFNLLPMLPLDGGHALQSLIELVTGRTQELLVRRISVATGAAIALLAFSQGYVFVAFYAALFIGINVTALREHKEGPLRERLREAYSLVESDPAGALARADDVLAAKPTAPLHNAALAVKVVAFLVQRDWQAAENLIEHAPPGFSISLQYRGVARLLAGDTDRGLAFVTEGIEHDKNMNKLVLDVAVETGCTDELTQRLRFIEFKDGQTWGPIFAEILEQSGHPAEAARARALLTDH